MEVQGNNIRLTALDKNTLIACLNERFASSKNKI